MKVLVNLFGAEGTWDELTTAFNDLLTGMFPTILSIMVALAFVFGAIIAWSFWSAGGDETKVQKAKANVKWYVIGWFALFLIVVATPILMEILKAWARDYGGL